MPKVTEEHRAARRQQILQAAWICFTENGFHATTMADVIKRSGLSAGAVYGYFPSKEALIRAAAEGTIGRIAGSATTLLDALDPPDPGVAVAVFLDQALETLGRDGIDRTGLAVHVFAEAQRSPELGELVGATHRQLRDAFAGLAQRAIDDGLLDQDADAVQIGSALFGLLPGFLVQHQLIGTSVEDYLAGVRTLLRRT